jgi:teichuronic acid biosynthesis glycosyltransferase TuaG
MTVNSYVSIISPTYNCIDLVKYTMESAIAQTHREWEMIAVDDASTDGTADLVEQFAKKDARIKLIRFDANQGAAVARNRALAEARHPLVAFLDSDDVWLPRKLERQLAFMLGGNHPITFSSYALINEDGTPYGRVVRAPHAVDRCEYLKTTIIGCSTAIVDRRQTGNFTFANLRTRQDTHLWISLLSRVKEARGLDEVLVHYRVRSGSISSNKIRAALNVWRLYQSFDDISGARATYYFAHYAVNATRKRLQDYSNPK